MAHDPRVFVGPQQTANGTGHQLHFVSGNSPALPGILQQGLRELSASEYAAWDGGNHMFRDVEARGR